ncbi:RHS repeat-associated core domain-containing protein [Chitinophaga tropicalis]|uniref:RHS repeat-associated core domain-containing protein n=1 Tax=Chitinophaga tropicalis TaxID=2683588 RepID=A0A7K1U7R7_9BACT|nr:RHS repeat-associated core domain-containing protein [Chitinophaga tropicalis]MVT10391.1 hypothetical protein [Chitinophaga tropicalis]
MAGDTIQAVAKAFYQNAGASQSAATAEEMVIAAISAFSTGNLTEGVHAALGVNAPIANNFTGDDYQVLKNTDPLQNLSDKPKAYLNYVLFDDQFKMVNENSGVRQVQGSPNVIQPLETGSLVIKKTGFIYIYSSNESAEDVFFDNLVVVHNSGPLLEETHYYPFGLTMAGISANALKGNSYTENRLKYNGKELQSGEFANGSGLEWYDYGARMYDQQIGRWHGIDAKSEKYQAISPYNYALNNPVIFVDPDGKDVRISINRETGAIELSSDIYVFGQNAGSKAEDYNKAASGFKGFSGSYTDEDGNVWTISIKMNFKVGTDEDRKRIEEAGSGAAAENMLVLDPLKDGASNEAIKGPDGRAEINYEQKLEKRNGINMVVGRELLTSRKSVLKSTSIYYSSALAALHETLHQYGLSDRYAGKNGLKETSANYKNDIMGDAHQLSNAQVSQTHYNNLGQKILELSKAKQSDNFISNVVVDLDQYGKLKGQ